MVYNPKDFYFKKAKERHYAARSVFKLEEIDQRFKILRNGQKILDLGCAPGSWSQYASQKIGNSGLCIGLDLAKVNLVLPNVKFYQSDAFSEEALTKILEELGTREPADQFDIVMSDMAPKTSGIKVQDQQRSFELCKRAFDVAGLRLKKGGTFIVKFFQSDEFDGYLKMLKPHFEKVEILRPKSTRKTSVEIFIIGLKKK